ncbi:LysE family translocator [Roseibium sediminis]|uniref:LysE family translocator n=1 Tax=Roseibium sediminis TaxID=1775174 RepID=UPI00123D2093|nr:LysE family translocator [Roseibium sediminis]
MTNIESLLLLFATAFAVSLIPGPSTLIAFMHGAQFGWLKSLNTALGNALASVTQAVAAAAGLGLIITTSATLFMIIKYLGAAYLVFIGLQMWHSAGDRVSATCHPTTKRVTSRQMATSGFMIAASNPKAIAFFTALFPQFLTAGESSFWHLASMVLVIAVVAFTVAALYGIAGAWFRSLELSRRLMQRVYKLTGGLFVVSGIGLAASRN